MMTAVKQWGMNCKWQLADDTDRCVECWNDTDRSGWEAAE
jgi:hypothetical protein